MKLYDFNRKISILLNNIVKKFIINLVYSKGEVQCLIVFSRIIL